LTATNKLNGGNQYLALEQRQLLYFVTAVRPIGEEKSELYPEPQYFNIGFMALAAQLPGFLRMLTERVGGPEAYGASCRRVLAHATALHLSGLAFLATWGREMSLLEDELAANEQGAARCGVSLSDLEAAAALEFSHKAVTHYRSDGRAYPSDTGALGTNYRILSDEDAEKVAALASGSELQVGSTVLRLLASIRALSFLMEGETREALMMHGPYPLRDGNQLVIFECSDLQWSAFPEFPLPGGVRWQLPSRPFPIGNLAIALVLRDVSVTADRFGTLYVEPLGPPQVSAAALLTRGPDEYVDEGLSTLPLAEARGLGRLCDDIQEQMFLQLAGWDQKQRVAAGVYQEHMLFLRMLAAAGLQRSQVKTELLRIFSRSQPWIDCYFERTVTRSVEQLPFYRKLGEFAAGQRADLFTPLTGVQRDTTSP
jgi:hypothetical protein